MSKFHSWIPFTLGATLCGVYWIYHYYSKSKSTKSKRKPLHPLQSSLHEVHREDETLNQLLDDKNPILDEEQTLYTLLYSFAQDQFRNQAIVHRSITCNHCQLSPVRGIRFKCSNCPDFDLCESCEALDVHVKTHVFLKIRIPVPPLANPRIPLCPRFYPGMDFTSSHPMSIDWEMLSESCHCKNSSFLIN